MVLFTHHSSALQAALPTHLSLYTLAALRTPPRCAVLGEANGIVLEGHIVGQGCPGAPRIDPAVGSGQRSENAPAPAPAEGGAGSLCLRVALVSNGRTREERGDGHGH